MISSATQAMGLCAACYTLWSSMKAGFAFGDQAHLCCASNLKNGNVL